VEIGRSTFFIFSLSKNFVEKTDSFFGKEAYSIHTDRKDKRQGQRFMKDYASKEIGLLSVLKKNRMSGLPFLA
jgi:hypothetical protein